MRLKSLLTAAIVTCGAAAVQVRAAASTITFLNAPFGQSTSYTESGYTVSVLAGTVYYNDIGNPDIDLEGAVNLNGGVVSIRATDGASFIFNGLDYAAYDYSNSGQQTLQVAGLLSGTLVGSELYTLNSTNLFDPTYANWTTESSKALAGLPLTELNIVLSANLADNRYEAVDNINLVQTSAATPEPSSFALLGTGLLGVVGVLRRKYAGQG